MNLAIERFHQTVRATLPQATNILEVGCGEGFSTQAVLANRSLQSFAGDIFHGPVEEAKLRYPDAHYSVLNALTLPFPDQSFDGIFSLEVLEHLDDPARAIQEFKRVARFFLLLSVPNEPIFRIQRLMSGKGIANWGDHPEHVNHWSLRSFQGFLQGQGLKIEKAVSPAPFAWSIVLCRIVSS